MEGKPSTAQALPLNLTLPATVGGKWVQMNGEPFFKIEAFHRLKPFFMSVPSDTDLWMFIASGGGLTAGRVDADGSLFPYHTVDQLHDAHHHHRTRHGGAPGAGRAGFTSCGNPSAPPTTRTPPSNATCTRAPAATA